MKITINKKEYNFEYRGWWGPLYKYEEIMDIANHPERKFNPAVTFHLHTMFYAILLTDNDTLDLTVEGFFSALEDLSLCNTLTEYYSQRVAVLTQGIHPAVENKKKVARSSRRKKPTSE